MPKSLCELINERPHLNKSSICKSIGIHRGNFDKYLQKGKFPDKIEKALFQELKIYGIEKSIIETKNEQKIVLIPKKLSLEERIKLAEEQER